MFHWTMILIINAFDMTEKGLPLTRIRLLDNYL
jgi:hypothetical protein